MAEAQIPFIDLCEEGLDLEGWKAMCKTIREACEGYGCFQVAYNKISTHLHDEVLMAMKTLYDLPEETRKKNQCSMPYFGFKGKSRELPLYQSLGIDNAPQLLEVKEFTDLMWPQGNPNACRAFNCMAAKILELYLLVMKMVLESFGLGKYYDSQVTNTNSILRLLKYDAPPTQDSVTGLVPHTDKTFLSLLNQHEQVHGLEVLSKDGNWIRVQSSPGSFIVLVGEMLEVFTNGRVKASQHKVVMNGDKERYSYGLFVIPNDGVVVEVPNELVDEDHPLRFRPFNFSDFIPYFASNYGNDALMDYANISSKVCI